MNKEMHLYDISDSAWEKIKPHTIGEKGTRGGNAKDTRQFINGGLRTGAPWRDLPAECEHWKNVHRRFCRWRDKGIWEKILAALIDDADFEWLMIDASHVKVHPNGSRRQRREAGDGGAQKGAQYENTPGRGYAHGMSVRFFVTDGRACRQ